MLSPGTFRAVSLIVVLLGLTIVLTLSSSVEYIFRVRKILKTPPH